eukprot:6276391-Prorocentrum_lima.AAC.1
MKMTIRINKQKNLEARRVHALQPTRHLNKKPLQFASQRRFGSVDFYSTHTNFHRSSGASSSAEPDHHWT